MHLPMICDRYELRDDVMPGAGRFRGGIGVVKNQRILTDGFITHECDRHEDVPWGIFGGGEGQCGAVEIYNAARPDDITDMPAKFAGLRVSEGDVMAFYGPCGGGSRSTGRRRRCWRTCWTISARWSMRGRRTGWWWISTPRPWTGPPPRRCGRGCGPTRGWGIHALRR